MVDIEPLAHEDAPALPRDLGHMLDSRRLAVCVAEEPGRAIALLTSACSRCSALGLAAGFLSVALRRLNALTGSVDGITERDHSARSRCRLGHVGSLNAAAAYTCDGKDAIGARS